MSRGTQPDLTGLYLAALGRLPDDLPATARLLIAYSGGLDSTVLLDLAARLRHHHQRPLLAVHVNHGLQSAAGTWADHCQASCERLGVDCIALTVDARAPVGESPEAFARERRYEAIRAVMQTDDILLTAHHQDDLAETLLLQLFRGAGPAGLAAMPTLARLGHGWQLRPLLMATRAGIRAYAGQHALDWIEDGSNTDRRYDRNFLRHEVMPVLLQRWPSLPATLSRAAAHQAAAAAQIRADAESDLAACAGVDADSLQVDCLTSLPEPRQANLLRHWLSLRGHGIPATARLQGMIRDLLHAGEDANPCVVHGRVCVRRYRNVLFLTGELPPPPVCGVAIHPVGTSTLTLALGSLSFREASGEGLRRELLDTGSLRVTYRRGGERLWMGGHHHELAKQFQAWQVPPCFRPYVPLIHHDDTLVAIPGLYLHPDYRARAGEASLDMCWDSSAVTPRVVIS